MLLSSKYVALHGMENEKWNMRDKILQYRSVLKLHARDKKLQAINAQKLKRKVTKTLRDLDSDIKQYRIIVSDVVCGDKRLLRSILQDQKDLQVLLQDASPTEAYRTIFQDYNLKRKQLDKLLHSKEKTMKNFCNLRSEHAYLTEEFEMLNEPTPVEEQQQKEQQLLLARYQGAMARHHAATSIGEMYEDIIVMLRKDSNYFDGVLEALRVEQKEQCRVILKTTMVGQLAIENLDDIRIKYKKMARDVWLNMKEREQTLEITRRRAEDVWEYAKSLVRVESDAQFGKKKGKKFMTADKRLERQVKTFEDIFDIIKDTLRIQSYEELFVRLEDQMKQRERLSELYRRYLKTRDILSIKAKHGDLMLHTLEHSSLSTTTQYKAEKQEMMDKIAEEKKREADSKSMIESRGELLMNIRAALQNLSAMLICMHATRTATKGKEKRLAREEDTEKVPVDKTTRPPCQDKIETDAIAVLIQVSRKTINLYAATMHHFDREKERRAKEGYQNYIANYRSELKFGGAADDTGMHFEHEAVDTGILTRQEMKIKSKQIVEANTQLE